MNNLQISLIVLVLLGLWIYWQNQPKNLNIQPSKELQDLKNQVVHYQTLYQKRVAKDLASDQTHKISQLETELSNQNQLIADYKTLETNLRTRIGNLETLGKNWNEANQTVTGNLNSALEKGELYQWKISDLETQLLNLARQKIKGKKDAEKVLNELETNWSKKEIEWEQEKQSFPETLSKIGDQITELKQDNLSKERTIEGLNESYNKLETYQKSEKELKINLLNKLDRFLENN